MDRSTAAAGTRLRACSEYHLAYGGADHDEGASRNGPRGSECPALLPHAPLRAAAASTEVDVAVEAQATSVLAVDLAGLWSPISAILPGDATPCAPPPRNQPLQIEGVRRAKATRDGFSERALSAAAKQHGR